MWDQSSPLFIELQPHELPIVQVPCQLFVRDELENLHLHLLFLLESLILVGRSWECRPLEQVFRAHAASCNPLALLLLERRQGMQCSTVMECATSTFNVRFAGHDKPLEELQGRETR